MDRVGARRRKRPGRCGVRLAVVRLGGAGGCPGRRSHRGFRPRPCRHRRPRTDARQGDVHGENRCAARGALRGRRRGPHRRDRRRRRRGRVHPADPGRARLRGALRLPARAAHHCDVIGALGRVRPVDAVPDVRLRVGGSRCSAAAAHRSPAPGNRGPGRLRHRRILPVRPGHEPLVLALCRGVRHRYLLCAGCLARRQSRLVRPVLARDLHPHLGHRPGHHDGRRHRAGRTGCPGGAAPREAA
jgi:hypothetical protein